MGRSSTLSLSSMRKISLKKKKKNQSWVSVLCLAVNLESLEKICSCNYFRIQFFFFWVRAMPGTGAKIHYQLSHSVLTHKAGSITTIMQERRFRHQAGTRPRDGPAGKGTPWTRTGVLSHRAVPQGRREHRMASTWHLAMSLLKTSSWPFTVIWFYAPTSVFRPCH